MVGIIDFNELVLIRTFDDRTIHASLFSDDNVKLMSM